MRPPLAARISATHPSPQDEMRMAYQTLQFIAYQINTVPTVKAAKASRPGLRDEHQDLDARCALMLRAIRTAGAHLAPAGESATLKVFLAPKYFFSGATGAYDAACLQRAVLRLQAMVAGPEWTDWLFVFGSIVVALPKKPRGQRRAASFTLLQRGAAPQDALDAQAGLHQLTSRDEPRIAVENASGALFGALLAPPPAKGAAGHAPPLSGAGVFTIDGITWSVGAQGHARQLPGQRAVQIHLSQATRARAASAYAAAQGGHVFNCDGSGLGESRLLLADALQLSAESTVAVPGEALETGAPSPRAVDPARLYQRGAGHIACYAPVPVPPPVMVEGTVLELSWPASPQYRFDFSLLYDSDGRFLCLTCRARARARSGALSERDHADFFQEQQRAIPLDLVGRTDPDYWIRMHLIRGSGASDASGSPRQALWCQIALPGFVFDGAALEFHGALDQGSPATCWRAPR
jgi:hypothetical protein